MSNKIYEKDFKYNLLKAYADLLLHRSYRKNVIRGLENIPADGAVILAPNHCNALMDAMVVLGSKKSRTVFGARADVFKKPAIGKFLRFLKIVPMVRSRDGLHNVLQNYAIMDEVVDVLEHKIPFCLYCEGTHRDKHSLLPISKGIFRIATQANEACKGKMPVYIVPVGLEYGDYERYRSTSIITYGKAINVSEWLEEHKDCGEAETFRQFRDMLRGKMAELITYINDDYFYDATWTLTKVASAGICDPVKKMESNKAAIKRIEKMLESDVDNTIELFEKADAFEYKRSKAKISFLSFGHKNPAVRLSVKTLTAILFLPYFLYCAVMSLPMWGLSIFCCSKVFKDRAFWNTGRYAVKLALTPIMLIIWALVIFLNTKFLCGLLLFIITLPAYAVFFDYVEFVRVIISDFRLLSNIELQKKFNYLKSKV